MRRVFVLAIALWLLLVPQAFALDRVIANSRDWRDVYSTLMYAGLQDVPASFLASSRHATLLLYQLGDNQDVQVIASDRDPWVLGYADIIRDRKGGTTEEIRLRNVNLELAERLPSVNKFIVVDDDYGYNALSVGSYASVGGYYVLFANQRTISEVEDFLTDRDPNDIIIYGQVDREVKQQLAQFNPETIDAGDRFDNNLEMVQRYLDLKPSKQAILSNGEFIEASMINGKDPVIFIGRDSVPDQVREFLAGSDIDIGILIGNELVGSATTIRRQAGISVFVKFAQGARNPSGPISLVEDLDRFPMPRIQLNVSIYSATYNKATNRLEVTYRNSAPQGAWLKGTITLSAGDETTTLGEEVPVFIEGNGYHTVTYETALIGDEMTATIFTVYGESKKSLEFSVQATLTVDVVTVLDDANIAIEDLTYNPRTNLFRIKVKNVGTVDAYANPEVIDVWMNGDVVTLGAEETFLVRSGESAWLEVPADLSDEDIERNENVRVRVYYGERETVLTKVAEAEFALRVASDDWIYYVLVGVVVLLILLLVFGRRRKKRHHQHS